MKNKIYIILLLLGGLLGIFSCTQYKNKPLNRGYHNMTARYNVYFYARESLNEGVVKYEKGFKDDYTRMLPVHVYPGPDNSKAMAPEMDRVIKKSTMCIQRHTIREKKTKSEIPGTGKWIDNAYIALGKGYFYKREFFSGIESFEYVAKTYKSKEKYEAWLWLLKTYNEMGLLSQSEPYISLIKNEKDFPKEFKDEFAALYAEFYLKQFLYDEAETQLIETIKTTKSKRHKARFSFILAQLYEEKKDSKKAIQYYNKCLKLKPAYEMVFNAKIKRSLLYDKNDPNAKSVKDELRKMLRDIKNEEYKDVIYYTLGQLEEKDKKTEQAYAYYKESVKNSVSNEIQKSRSYLRLAEIDFDREHYTHAAAYYDSTVTLMKEDYPDYKNIVAKRSSLNQLVNYLNTIKQEDSLQKVARMDTASRNTYIDKIIARLKEEEEKKKQEEELNNENPLNTGNSDGGFKPNDNNGSWYFYNPTTKSFGVNDFIKKWGNGRKLEDNWRRSNKQVVLDPLVNNTNDTTANNSDSLKKNPLASLENDKYKRAYYLRDLPLTQALVDSSDKKILNAYYSLAGVYRELLNNNKRAVEALVQMNTRFNRNKYEPNAYYTMYRIFLQEKNQAKAEECKQYLQKNYPESDYTKIINDPEFAKAANAKKGEVEQVYTKAYQHYLDSNYTSSLQVCVDAIRKYNRNDFSGKFAFLKALCVARLQPIDSLAKALRQVTTGFPKEEVYAPAKAMLDVVERQMNPVGVKAKEDSLKAADKGTYQVNDDTLHFWVMVIPNGKGSSNAFQTALSEFHNKYYSTAGLKPSLLSIDFASWVVVKSFKNKTEAMTYHNLINSRSEVFKDVKKEFATYFAIGAENMSKLLKKKDLKEYQTFFNSAYLGLKP